MATPGGALTPTGAQPPVSSGTAAAVRRAHPARVAGLFGLLSLGVLTLVYLLVRVLGLPDWAFAASVGLLTAGLPIMLWTGLIERRRSEEHTSELQSQSNLVCRLLLEKKKHDELYPVC